MFIMLTKIVYHKNLNLIQELNIETIRSDSFFNLKSSHNTHWTFDNQNDRFF